MLKVSKLADYATLVMVHMANDKRQLHNAKDIALHTHVALPTVSKILKAMAKADLLVSLRGAHGGYKLIHHPSTISVAQIINAIDGNFAMTDCSLQKGLCNIERFCQTRNNWQLISRAIYDILEYLTLEDMAKTKLTAIPITIPKRKKLTPLKREEFNDN
ncbi:MAG: SUF system Fe-S cluster assembly regulator [Pseudomonadota bacterium]